MTAPPATQACAAALAIAAAFVTAPAPAQAALLDEPPRPTTFKLDDPTAAAPLPLLGAYKNAAVERPGPMRLYLSGRYGRWLQRPWMSFAWGGAEGEGETESAGLPSPEPNGWEPVGAPEAEDPEPPAADLLELLQIAAASSPTWLKRLDPTWSASFVATGPSLASNGFNLLWDPPKKPVRDWRCRRRPVQFVRYGGERGTFALVHCDGAVAPEALDRLSILARPPEAPSPGELLPDEPDAAAWQALEWVPQVRVLHPRLLWLLQRVADAFPYRTVYIFSGYRPKTEATRKSGHHSLHSEGRAMDIMVMGVPNASLFKLCRTLDDVGCGYYPNSKFVHVDVRRPATGHAFWIDISGPGEPSRYVDAWPGVVEEGAMSWSAGGPRTTAPPPP